VVAAVTAAVLWTPAAYIVVVPVIAWALVMPATVRVPLEAVIEPAVTLRDAEEAMPVAATDVAAVMAAELWTPAP
jgi:hypothetical protein